MAQAKTLGCTFESLKVLLRYGQNVHQDCSVSDPIRIVKDRFNQIDKAFESIKNHIDTLPPVEMLEEIIVFGSIERD